MTSTNHADADNGLSQQEITETLTRIRKTKEDIVAAFLEQHKDEPKQGDEQWHENRNKGIGASEVSDMLGSGRGSILNLIKKKIGLKGFRGNTACYWGHFFEEVNRQLTSARYGDCHIYEFSSIQDKECPYIRGSPDGVAVTYITKTIQTPLGPVQYTIPQICLLEFKCPYTIVPDYQVIPKNYLQQVLSCMCSLGITEHGIYSACMMRRCSFEMWCDETTTLTYDRQYHYKRTPEEVTTLLKKGLVGLYTDDNDEGRQYVRDITLIQNLIKKNMAMYGDANSPSNTVLYDPDDPLFADLPEIATDSVKHEPSNPLKMGDIILLDYGSIGGSEFNTALYDVKDCEKPPTAFYPALADGENIGTFLQKFGEFCRDNNKIPYGVVPWKLFMHNTIEVVKQCSFNKEIHPTAQEIMKTVEKIKEYPGGTVEGFMKICGLAPDDDACRGLIVESDANEYF